jgi:hypothetical protein
MLIKKMKILSEFKTPLPLMQCEKIKVMLPYEDGRILEKNSVSICDAESGMIELKLTEFELQGLKPGKNSFLAKVYMYSVVFHGGMNIEQIDGRKSWT